MADILFSPWFVDTWRRYPADTWRNNNVIIASKRASRRRFDAVMTLWLRYVCLLGMGKDWYSGWMSVTSQNFQSITTTTTTTHPPTLRDFDICDRFYMMTGQIALALKKNRLLFLLIDCTNETLRKMPCL